MAAVDHITQHFQCPICRNLFENPVILRCTHALCKSCLNQPIDMSDPKCPLCPSPYTGQRGQIPCDNCEENQTFIAVRSCLTCLLSYCEGHLRRHQSMERLRGHRLVNPLERWDERLCSVHSRLLDLYSTRDKRCICALCVTPGQDVIPVETERRRREAEHPNNIDRLKRMINQRENELVDLQNTLTSDQDEINREETEIGEVFAAVRRAEEELLAPLEERKRSLEEKMEEKTQKIQDYLEEYKKLINHLNQTQNEKDDFLFLQSYPSVPAELRDDLRVSIDTKLNFSSMRNITTSVLTFMRTQLENLRPFVNNRITEFSVNVTLDEETAHPALQVSQDGKSVRVNGNVQNSPRRFDLVAGIMGNLQITSGKAFWLVEVGQQTGWKLGVVRENANRKEKVSYKPSEGYWTIVFCDPNTYGAFEENPIHLHLSTKPKKIGVFVDYESDLISFYNMNDLSHIYTFTQCRFSGTIRPYFNPQVNTNVNHSDPMIVSSVNPTDM